MEQRDVRDPGQPCLSRLIKLHENAVLQVLRLQEGLTVNRTVEEAFEAQIPEEVLRILPLEEVLVEVDCEV